MIVSYMYRYHDYKNKWYGRISAVSYGLFGRVPGDRIREFGADTQAKRANRWWL